MEAARKAEVDRAKAEAMADGTIAAANEPIKTHQEATSHEQTARRAWGLVAMRQSSLVSSLERCDSEKVR